MDSERERAGATSGAQEQEGLEGKDEEGRRDKWQRAFARL